MSQQATSAPAGVLVARGSLAAEETLLRLLSPWIEPPADLAALAVPVRIVVPSRSLRLHLAALLARRRGALLGVHVQTLAALAREVVERLDPDAAAAADGDLAFEILVRRLARSEPALARGLDGLVDGYAAASATVRDLLDAGLLPIHAEPADEALAASRTGERGPRATREQVERARALVRVAARVEHALDDHRALRSSGRLRLAADLIARDPDAALPSRAVLVHGFADATGVATDLIEALLAHRGARLVLDDPPDVGGGTGGEPGEESGEPVALPRDEAFSARFRERLAGSAGLAAAGVEAAGEAPIEPTGLLASSGADAEAREVAHQVRRVLDGGARPEAIGIVARDLAPHRVALRRHLRALGVPFSGVDEPGTLAPAGRRVQGLLDLLRRREELPADRWLDAVARLPGPVEPAEDGMDGESNAPPEASDPEAGTGGGEEGSGAGRPQRPPFVDLRLALATLAAGRLRDVARLGAATRLRRPGSISLPLRRGLSSSEAEPEAGGRATRRRIGTGRVLAAAQAARDLVGRLDGWPERAAPDAHLDRIELLLTLDLGWDRSAGDTRPVFEALDRLRTALPPSLALDVDELRLALARALEGVGREALGGRGGGVQVLTVTEARARTWDSLFVLGVHRGAFPRTVREDPLLPDPLREELTAVLPDLARKRAGFAEERHLFAQLLSASPRTAVSWQSHDDEGQPLGPSPLAERLAAAQGGRTERAAAPGSSSEEGRAGDPPRVGPVPARDVAIAAAVRGASRPRLEPLLAAAIAESQAQSPGGGVLRLDPGRIAAARLAALDEIDPDRRTPEGRATAAGLGPFFGFLGRPHGPLDPRGGDLWVTHAERVATCPWQHVLRRLLALEPTPDPLQALPGADPLLLGIVVHEVLSRIVDREVDERPADLVAALGAEPVRVRWPGAETFEAMLLAAAEDALGRDGVALPGLVRALAEQARPALEAARRLDWADPAAPPAVLAAEVTGEVDAGVVRPRRLRFRADRVDHTPAGPLLSDFKTGRPITDAKTPATRARHLMARVAGGRNLQAVAYGLAAAAAGHPGAAGRYVYLAAEADRADLRLDAGDPDAVAAFHGAVDAVGAAWDEGGFFPRLVDAKGNTPPPCAFCEVAEACLQGDSGSRLRLGGWIAARLAESEAGVEAPTAPEAAVLAVWNLGTPEEADPK